MGRFIEALHPRDSHGRFRRKGKLSFRVGLRSVTATYGKTFPIVPGKVGLHLGVLARLENISEKRGYLARLSDQALAKIGKKLPAKQREVVEGIVKRRQATVGGVQLHRIGGQRRASSVRISKAVAAPARRTTSGVRAPRRKPRTRSLNRATQGRKIR